MAPTIILVSGANRGIGKGLLERFLAKPNHIVIAANRDPEHATSKALFTLPTGTNSRLIVVKVDASSGTDAFEAVKQLVAQGINHIDVVIANAGISNVFPKVEDLKMSDLQAHLTANVFGVVWLYQATLPLLKKAANPRFITMGSMAGSIGVCASSCSCEDQYPIPNAAYGTSKAAIHWLTRRMDAEADEVAAFVISPGWVQTDMGNSGAKQFGMEEAPLSLDDSCNLMMPLIEQATKELRGGRFWDQEGALKIW